MLMLFWDEWMGFDWYAFRQFLFTLGSLCTLISLVAMTEASWWQPYASILGYFTDEAAASSSASRCSSRGCSTTGGSR